MTHSSGRKQDYEALGEQVVSLLRPARPLVRTRQPAPGSQHALTAPSATARSSSTSASYAATADDVLDTTCDSAQPQPQPQPLADPSTVPTSGPPSPGAVPGAPRRSAELRACAGATDAASVEAAAAVGASATDTDRPALQTPASMARQACTLARAVQSSMRRYCRAEMLDSSTDRSLFAELPMRSALRELRLPHARRLAGLEWAAVRGAIGRPRRFSAAFVREERARLRDARTNIALAQRACPPTQTLSGPLLAAVPVTALPGDVVSAVHPRTGLPELAVVLAAHPVRHAITLRFLAGGRGAPVEVQEPDVFPVGASRELHPAVRPALMPTVVVSQADRDGQEDPASSIQDDPAAVEGQQSASISLVAVVEPKATGWGPSLRDRGRTEEPFRLPAPSDPAKGRTLFKHDELRGWELHLRASAQTLVRRVRFCLARQTALLDAFGAGQPAQPVPTEPATTRWVRAELESCTVALDTACASLRRVRRTLRSFRSEMLDSGSATGFAEQSSRSYTASPDRRDVPGVLASAAVRGHASLGVAALGRVPLPRQSNGTRPGNPEPARRTISPQVRTSAGHQFPGNIVDLSRRPSVGWHRPQALAASVVLGARSGCHSAMSALVEASGRSCGVVMGRQATASKKSIGGAFSALFADTTRPCSSSASGPVVPSAQHCRSPKRLRSLADDWLGHLQRKRRAAARSAAVEITGAIDAPAVASPVALAARCTSADSLLRSRFSEAAVGVTSMLEVLCWQATRRGSSFASSQAALHCCAALFPRHSQNLDAWNNLVSAVSSVQALALEAGACCPTPE